MRGRYRTQWADMVVVATKGQISYSVQMVGSSKLDGVLLPASPGAKGGAVFAFYAVLVISATGIETFNLSRDSRAAQRIEVPDHVGDSCFGCPSVGQPAESCLAMHI